MQRRDINKRLSFAEAENGQKDRNKEEVEEEREPATKKGINKSGSECEGKKERERGRGESAAPDFWLSSPLSLCSTNVPIYYFRGIRPSFRIGKLLFPPCRGWQVYSRLVNRGATSFIGRILEARFVRRERNGSTDAWTTKWILIE